MPSPFRRTYTINGKVKEVPKRGRRLPPPNRLQEIHGLAGAIGEQLGLAWTAEQDVQRFVETRARRHIQHQRLVQRALAELAGHFVLGASHSTANLVLRLLMLNPHAAASLAAAYPKANGFPPDADHRHAWLTLNTSLLNNLATAAGQSGNRFMVDVVATLGDLYASSSFTALDMRRGLDYHRRRPQSVEHVSPRRGIVEHLEGYTKVSMPAPAFEDQADAEQVHEIVVDALDDLRAAMRDVRRVIPKIVRAEEITYIF